jgi:tyrosine-protein kinase Etk/Wzc
MTALEHEAPLTIRELADTLRGGRRLLAACVTGALALGALSVVSSEPVYRAEGLLQLEERSKALDPLADDPSPSSNDSPAEAEIDIIRSHSVVLEAVESLHLDVAARPWGPPVIGRLLTRGQRIRVDALEVPAELLDRPLALVAGGEGRYALRSPDGAQLLEGRVGETASSGPVTILVSELSSRPGGRFQLVKQSPAEAVEGFLSRLSVSEKGRRSGVIELELLAPDPDQAQAQLAALLDVYLRRDVERRTQSTQRRLEFVNSQLPELKENLAQAELRLKQYRAETGQLDIGLQSKAIIDRGQAINDQITQLQLQLADLRQRFTQGHPSMIALDAKLRQLLAARRQLERKAEARPDSELSWARLDRDVKVAGELYMRLLSKGQELAVWKAAGMGSVRLADPAFARRRPVKPDVPATLAVSLFAGVTVGLVGALVRRGRRSGAAALERALGLPVYACLPRSRRRDSGTLLALAAPDDPFVEGLRALRARLDHELEGSPNKVVVLTSSRLHRGTALVAANLGILFATSGRKVLLVDADLRRRSLGRHFHRPRHTGFAELLEGQPLEALCSAPGVPNLAFLAAGAPALTPSELLGRPSLAAGLERASRSFDVVLCAAPPVLPSADAALLARAAFSTLLVVKDGEHPLDELELAAARLGQCGGRPSGLVVNAARSGAGFELT